MTTRGMFGALVLGSVLALSTGAAMAAPPPPSFSFGIHVGPDSGPPLPPPPDVGDCLSNRAIMAQLRYAGYRDFTNFDDSGDGSFFVDARRGARWYELEVDSCSGDILNRTRIKYPN